MVFRPGEILFKCPVILNNLFVLKNEVFKRWSKVCQTLDFTVGVLPE